jgi:hypothetical protein
MSATAMMPAGLAPQLDRAHDTMSISNILTTDSVAAAAPEAMDTTPDLVAPSTPTVAPSTPTKNGSYPKEEELNESPDTVMSDAEDAGDMDDGDITGEINDGEDVPDSQREFICKNDETSRCLTGQYEIGLSRKVISDHFGRNKGCTRDLTSWPLFCRKHYQRATYNKDLWQIRKINLIYRQFDVIEKDFPGTTYDVQLKKSEEARLNEYSRKIAGGKTPAEAAAHVAPKAGKAYEAPIDILRELDNDDLGKNKTIKEVKITIERILEMLADEESTEDAKLKQVPSIEFLPNIPGKIASPKKTPKKAATPKKKTTPKAPKTPTPKKTRAVNKTPTSKRKTTPKAPVTPSRISTKGGIKKTNE